MGRLLCFLGFHPRSGWDVRQIAGVGMIARKCSRCGLVQHRYQDRWETF